MKLTKEEQSVIEQNLSYPFGGAKLICDGNIIDLRVQRYKGMTYRVSVYVNGCWKGEWLSAQNSHPEQKFLRKSERSVYSPAMKAKLAKVYGKKKVEKDPEFNKKLVFFFPDFANGKSALRHLMKVCDSVQIASE